MIISSLRGRMNIRVKVFDHSFRSTTMASIMAGNGLPCLGRFSTALRVHLTCTLVLDHDGRYMSISTGISTTWIPA
jgi:hypothetical protein